MLSAKYSQSDDRNDSTSRGFSSRMRSASMSIPTNSLDSFEGFTSPLRTERRNSFVQMSGPLFVSRNHEIEEYPSMDGNPHTRVQRWNRFFVISCLFALFIDPLFFFLLSVEQDYKCIVLNWPLTLTIVVLRSMTDFIYLFHMLLQFRLAYVAPESRVAGAGDLVDDPKKIAKNYLFEYFLIDLFAVLPLPQILILQDLIGATGSNYAKNLLSAAIPAQYLPRLCRFLPLLASSATGFIFELGWANFVINFLMYVLASHIVGSFWYLFGLQRVNKCLLDACRDSNITRCLNYIDCGRGNDYERFQNDPTWDLWKRNDKATACFGQHGFEIYQNARNLTTHQNVLTRYIYSLFWGFQYMAGNQVPSYYVWEVIFTLTIILLGLSLFALLIGNMQNFLQGFGRRSLEMSLRSRDIEQWMSHLRLPEELRRQVRGAERFNWAATRGVNEEMLMENLPEDLQRDIRRHLFNSVKKVRMFQLMDEPIIDAICERLRTKTYIKGSKILYRGGVVDKMVFVIRGKMESIGEDLIVVPLSEGDVCGEELLTWYIKHSSVNEDGKRIRIPGHRLLSKRLVRCLTNVEAVILRVADLEEVASLFSRFLRSPRMDPSEKDKIPMLSATYSQSDDRNDSTSRGFSSRMRSASMSIPTNFLDSFEYENNLVGLTSPLRTERQNSFVQMSGPLFVSRNREIEEYPSIDGNPHTRVQRWNRFFVISCLFAVFIDPLFFFLLSVEQDYKCIVLNWPLTVTIVVLRSMTDFIYLFHILLQFKLAYVAPESRVAGAGDLVDDPKKIAKNYLFGYFLIDLFAIIILLILPNLIGTTGSNYAKNLLRAAIPVQYLPRLYRFLPLLASSATGFIFVLGWANFVINLLMYVLASHIVGSFWYLFGLQRVNKCLLDACRDSNITRCPNYIDCGRGNDYERFQNDPTWDLWKRNDKAAACFGQHGFEIYQNARNLTTHQNVLTRYVYSLFWGFQQLSTLAGNQVPSYYVWEVIFTMTIILFGLSLFALLIGNMQNFLQGLGRRSLEMSLRSRDIEQWMNHRRLPEELKRRVRGAERFNWAATRGVNEEMLMENLPEDLQRDIRRHLFNSVKKVRMFQLLDEPIIDAICERLRTKTYIKGSKILYRGGVVDKMVFVIRGKMESIGEDLIVVPLSEGDVCGEELLTWYIKHSSVNEDGKRIRIPGHRLLSKRLVRCLTNVEVVILRVADLEEVASLFSRFLRSPRVQGAIRYKTRYWRGFPARRIQVAWRYRKKRD
ncbi:hypothetical protein ACJIZ3_011009 [Penstemon smallii]|uniref:Cyclic nucleotide-binding domain-containing protein n=1 Tax=Penstemon smallii TaxID=265156 RepID=A0ABD3ULJ8_9LAMI